MGGSAGTQSTGLGNNLIFEGNYLIHDRALVFGDGFKATMAAASVKTLELPAKSPNLNVFCARFNRTIIEEWPDHFVICFQRHLEVLVRKFCEYYRRGRRDHGLGNREIGPMKKIGDGEIKQKSA